MRIHLHTLCWNNGPMLDFFFRHYETWVDRFYILDDGSTDGSCERLAARDNVVLGKVEWINPSSWVMSARHIYNNAWKESIGEADWVIVTNIDEHLYHPEIKNYLARALHEGVTAIPSLGYQMLSDESPRPNSLLWRDYPLGCPWINMSKLDIFRPDCIAETNYGPGRHRAAFQGDVFLPERDEVCNLHYKYLGLEATHARHQALEARLGEYDRECGFGHKYRWSKARLKQDFEHCKASVVDVRAIDHHLSHTEPRWWRDARLKEPEKGVRLNKPFSNEPDPFVCCGP